MICYSAPFILSRRVPLWCKFDGLNLNFALVVYHLIAEMLRQKHIC